MLTIVERILEPFGLRKAVLLALAFALRDLYLSGTPKGFRLNAMPPFGNQHSVAVSPQG
jgi:hypothetical protein